MKKILVLALVLIVVLSMPALATKKATIYINGIDPNYPPCAYIDKETGHPAGFDVDALTWIAKKMGFTVQHKPVAWDGIIPALLAKKIDMIASGMSITSKRCQQVDFSEPYWHQYRVFLVKADSNLTLAEILSKKELKLGVKRGTSETEAIKAEQKEKGYPFVLSQYDSTDLAIADILNDRIDAALMDSLPANDAIAKKLAVKIAGIYGDQDSFGVAIRKGDTKLMKLLNDGYKLLMADPYWKELQKKYFSN